MLEMLDYTIRIAITPTILYLFFYFDLYLNTAYAARYILRFCLTTGLRSKRQTLLSILAVHQPFYISICISTLPAQHTTFYVSL